MPVMQQSATVKTPQTRAEVEAMVGRRDELKGQLRDAENRRLNLAAQLDATPTSARAPVQGRLAAMDARIAQLERQVAQMDEAISNAMANPNVAQSRSLLEQGLAPPPPPPGDVALPGPVESFTLVPPQSAPPSGVERMLFAGGIGAVLLAVLTGWIAYRMAVRRLRGSGTAANTAHMSQLQQSIDAIALEVERISENQRYVTKVVNSLGAGAAEAVQSERAGEHAPIRRSP